MEEERPDRRRSAETEQRGNDGNPEPERGLTAAGGEDKWRGQRQRQWEQPDVAGVLNWTVKPEVRNRHRAACPESAKGKRQCEANQLPGRQRLRDIELPVRLGTVAEFTQFHHRQDRDRRNPEPQDDAQRRPGDSPQSHVASRPIEIQAAGDERRREIGGVHRHLRVTRQPHHREGECRHGRAWSVLAFARELQPVETERRPGGGMNLIEVSDVREHHTAETVDQPAEDASQRGPRQPPYEEKGGGAGNDVGREQKPVPVDGRQPEQMKDRIPGQRLRVRGNRIAGEHRVGPQRRAREEGGHAEIKRIAGRDVVPAQEAPQEKHAVEGCVTCQRRRECARIPRHSQSQTVRRY